MIFRKVVKREWMTTRYNRPNEGSYKHIMECGHFEFAKKSAGLPKRKRCRDCEQLVQLALKVGEP
jgi:hypothetical protein